MTPDSAGEPRSASGRTMTPRAAFWCALSIWMLTLATAATALIYNHVHPLPPKRERRHGKRGGRHGRGDVHRGLRHRRRAARRGNARRTRSAGSCPPPACRMRSPSSGCCCCNSPVPGSGPTGWAGSGFSASGSWCSSCCSSRPVRCPRAAGGRWRGPPPPPSPAWALGNAFAPTIISAGSPPCATPSAWPGRPGASSTSWPERAQR